MTNPSPNDEISKRIEARLSGTPHVHHRHCIHNLPPEEQVAMRGVSVDWWLTVVGPLPTQITSADWDDSDV